ncbi:MAG: bifunctional UDP-N-acetylglucosamine diphosphorylase/glucosamine-1-phosphate N-acetyltransferase GlmU [Rhodospirillales bacterium]|nr:bifunctional UDP-N-acetylglucosamine diphosphorylase/glucosamine-1-phosphate N-acetyltransferase GlmU [Rhodospirillales bacterium]
MSKNKTAVIVLAAGMGTRMKSDLPKVMHPLAGRPMIKHLLATVEGLKPERIAVVVGPDMDDLEQAVAPHPTAIQTDRLGTGHAVLAAREALEGFTGDVLIVYGDTPLLSKHTLVSMLEARRTKPNPAVVVLGFRPFDPGQYGRLMVDEEGDLNQIVEFNDATAEEKEEDLCNSGVMCVDGKLLFNLLDQVTNDNAKGEYYLTDIVELAGEGGSRSVVVEGDEEELLGINSRVELAAAEAIIQDDMRTKAMENGVTLLDPSTVYFSHDTKIGKEVTIEPNVFFGPGVTIGDHVHVRAFCHLEGATLEGGSTIGPFARLRPGSQLDQGAKVGNFVEVKNAVLEKGAKVSHLTYIGDARVGEEANVGAGTITCNYDGFDKSHTDIGAGAFIGSNTALVAPVKIGDGAIVGAGSTVTKDVAPDALAVSRADQRGVDSWAKRFRQQKNKD